MALHGMIVYFCLSPWGWCKTPGGWWRGRLKISELAQGFSDGCAIHGSKRLASSSRGLSWFLWVRTATKKHGVDFGFCHSYKICENLRESVGKINHTGSVLIRICSVRGLTVMLTVTAVWATRFKYCQPSFQKLGEGCGSVKSIIVNIVFVW